MATGSFTNVSATFNSVPSPRKQTLESNYLDLASTTDQGWAQQYMPDLMAEEAEVFGNRTIGGFLEMVGAEEPMTADQVVWSEQGRLHLSYQGNCTQTAGATYTFQIVKDIDDNVLTGGTGTVVGNHGVRLGDLVMISNASATVRGYVTAISAETNGGSGAVYAAVIGIAALTDDGTGIGNVAASVTDTTCGLLVYGSAYGKGTTGRAGANSPVFKSFMNHPTIMKDKYEVSGSDASQIGWVEVTGEDGQNGYLWYLKAAGDTKSRFADYVEMGVLEGELVTNTVASHGQAASGNNLKGTEGFFAAVTARGNLFDGIHDTGTTGTVSNVQIDFDAMIGLFDEQGAIEEYMMFLDRATSLRIDDWLASANSYGSGGTSYGVFDNSEDMALNLGFSGFRRAAYDFYKTDWKYLNDKSTRGGLKNTDEDIRGAFVPAGVTTVYDQTLGQNLKRPFLHVRYRASNMDDRRFKTWTTGSVGAATSDLDAMEMHFLSERCLVTQGANNFVLIKATA
tara:strand:- start:1262 stop:2791 length:1530 start_codon:yes stop_codon:yes gene_type:complete